MGSPIQQRILDALLMALRPLARALLRAGVGYREFEDIAKAAFVHVAAEEFGLRGRETNSSRIAVMTGITRKEIRAIRERGPGVLAQEFVRESPASVMLYQWHNDPNYLDENGKARVLSFDEGEYSFAKLVSTYAGDIPPGAMKTELKRVDAIEVSDNDTVIATKEFYAPEGVDDKLELFLQEILATATHTLAYNCDPKRRVGVDTRFLSIASVDNVDEKYFPEVKRYASQGLTKLGTEFSSYLTDLQSRSDPKSSEHCQVGIGLYYYELGTED